MQYNIVKYPDNSHYVQVEEFSDKLIFRIDSYEDLWTLRQIKDVCDHNKVKVNLIIPRLFDAQADKRFNENESANLKLVCEFINNMKWESVTIFHPHNQEAIEMAIDDVKVIDNQYFINQVLNDLYLDFRPDKKLLEKLEDHLILMSTDAGGFKPLMKLCDKLKWRGETFSASKSRKYEQGSSKLIQQIDKEDFQGKDILIIDDICVNGGTFLGLAKMLKEKNCGKLFLAVSHLTVDEPNRLLFSSFDKIFITDSKNTKINHEKLVQLEINL